MVRRMAGPESTWASDQGARLLALYDEAWDDLVRLAHLLTGSVAVAEDVVQEAFLRVAASSTPLREPRAYLRRAVVNGCRSHQRRGRVEQRWRDRQPAPPVVLDPEVEEVWAKVARLPEPQRHALVLRFHEDMTVPAIAEALGRPVGTVKSDIHRGLAALSEEVTP